MSFLRRTSAVIVAGVVVGAVSGLALERTAAAILP